MATTVPRDARSWRPAENDELAWFKVGGILPTHPKALELTGAVHAFTYGLTHALESQYFPLYEIRPRAIDGQLYLAVVPSGLADRDIETRIRTVSDRTIRFRDVMGTWKREIQPQVQADLERMAAFPPHGVSGAALHEDWLRLRRVRANQWFAPIRAVLCPAAFFASESGQAPSGETLAAVEEVREVVIREGAQVFDADIARVGDLLVQMHSLDAAEDVLWLDFGEVSAALERRGGGYQATVAERKAAAATLNSTQAPETRGAPLDRTDRRLFLLPEIFDLLGVASPLGAHPT
jgi:hypothetical protein